MNVSRLRAWWLERPPAYRSITLYSVVLDEGSLRWNGASAGAGELFAHERYRGFYRAAAHQAAVLICAAFYPADRLRLPEPPASVDITSVATMVFWLPHGEYVVALALEYDFPHGRDSILPALDLLLALDNRRTEILLEGEKLGTASCRNDFGHDAALQLALGPDMHHITLPPPHRVGVQRELNRDDMSGSSPDATSHRGGNS